MKKKAVTILSIESSCDETSAAVIRDGHQVLSCVVASQIPIHQRYGGVVPEIAARAHVEQIGTVIETALKESFPNHNYYESLTHFIDYIAVTHGPGLIGSLLVGVNAAKTISRIYSKPILPINHILGHVYSNFLNNPEYPFPFITLVASGGHTDLILSKHHGDHALIAATRDDAAGEAFDKAAQLLNLSYPGGPSISKQALLGDKNKFKFPRGLNKSESLDFSFSGLKTSLLQLINDQIIMGVDIPSITNDLAASYQNSIIDSLVTKTIAAAKIYDVKNVFIAGGVSANKALREEFALQAKQNNLNFYAPNLEYCTDNAAMIGAAAFGSVLLSHTHNCYDVNVTRDPSLTL